MSKRYTLLLYSNGDLKPVCKMHNNRKSAIQYALKFMANDFYKGLFVKPDASYDNVGISEVEFNRLRDKVEYGLHNNIYDNTFVKWFYHKVVPNGKRVLHLIELE